MTDRWQKFTQVPVSEQTIEEFSSHCDEFLVHAVCGGKGFRIEVELVKLLAKESSAPGTYAGGVGSFRIWRRCVWREKIAGRNCGSALDLFGGSMSGRMSWIFVRRVKLFRKITDSEHLEKTPSGLTEKMWKKYEFSRNSCKIQALLV